MLPSLPPSTATDLAIDQWVIVADDGSDAGRLYRAAGFTPGHRAYGYHAASWR